MNKKSDDITAGITQKLGGTTQVAQNANAWNKFQTNLVNSSKTTLANSASRSIINGESLNLNNSLKQMLTNSIAATGANYIGEAKYNGNINTAQQLLLHTGLGYIQGELNYGDGISGTIGGAVGEGTALLSENTLDFNKQTNANVGKLMSVIAGAMISQNANGVYASYDAGTNSVENNYLQDYMRYVNSDMPGASEERGKIQKTMEKTEEMHEDFEKATKTAGKVGSYNIMSNNCQDYCTKTEIEYKHRFQN